MNPTKIEIAELNTRSMIRRSVICWLVQLAGFVLNRLFCIERRFCQTSDWPDSILSWFCSWLCLKSLVCASFVFCVVGVFGCHRASQSGESAHQVREGKVIGASMAPNFLGEHFEFQCENCKSDVVADFEQANDREKLVCPFCGATTAVSSCRRQGSDRVNIELGFDLIKRWDVVAFHVPQTQEAGIKRVVGLPGESIEIRAGNLWIDGAMIRKSIDQQTRTRILVHDSSKTSAESVAWRSVDSGGLSLGSAGHRFDAGQFVVSVGDSQQSKRPEMNWFQFCNHRNYAHDFGPSHNSDDSVPIQDHYGYNQSLSRNLNVVNEIFVAFQFNPSVARQVGWKFQHDSSSLSFEVDVQQKTLLIERSGEFVGPPRVRVELAEELLRSSKTEIQFTTIDRMVFVLIGGKEVARFEWRSPDSAIRVQSEPGDNAKTLFQIGAAVEAGAEDSNPLGRVRIWRDIYYLPLEPRRCSQALDGDADGYVLLGDNQPVSVDSRNWTEAAVPSDQLIGKVQK